MQIFFQELYSHVDKNSGEMFEDMFLVKIASKGTFLILGLQVCQLGICFARFIDTKMSFSRFVARIRHIAVRKPSLSNMRGAGRCLRGCGALIEGCEI